LAVNTFQTRPIARWQHRTTIAGGGRKSTTLLVACPAVAASSRLLLCCMRPVSSRSGREHLRSICKSYSRLAALDRHALLQRFSFASALLMGIWMCWMQSGASCAFANPASTWQRWLIWVLLIQLDLCVAIQQKEQGWCLCNWFWMPFHWV